MSEKPASDDNVDCDNYGGGIVIAADTVIGPATCASGGRGGEALALPNALPAPLPALRASSAQPPGRHQARMPERPPPSLPSSAL